MFDKLVKKAKELFKEDHEHAEAAAPPQAAAPAAPAPVAPPPNVPTQPAAVVSSPASSGADPSHDHSEIDSVMSTDCNTISRVQAVTGARGEAKTKPRGPHPSPGDYPAMMVGVCSDRTRISHPAVMWGRNLLACTRGAGSGSHV